MFKLLFKIFKILLIVALLGGGVYYLLDYKKGGDNDFIQSTKDFSGDAIDKVKETIDSSEAIQDFQKK